MRTETSGYSNAHAIPERRLSEPAGVQHRRALIELRPHLRIA
jgi:hypothetical protein